MFRLYDVVAESWSERPGPYPDSSEEQIVNKIPSNLLADSVQSIIGQLQRRHSEDPWGDFIN